MFSQHVHSAELWHAHADQWSSSVQSITWGVCDSLLRQMDAMVSLDAKDVRILDDGAGSGQATGILNDRYSGVSVVASDISKGMLEAVDKKKDREGWGNTETVVQDAQNLDALVNSSFSHVICTFVIGFTERPERAIDEMYRVLRPEGAVGIPIWTHVSWISCWEDAVHKVSGNEEYRAPSLFHDSTMSIDWMKKRMQESGFTECYLPEWTVEQAVEWFYSHDNPSIKLLKSGRDKEFLHKTRNYFAAAYAEKYDHGKKRQFEVAILAVGRKPRSEVTQ